MTRRFALAAAVAVTGLLLSSLAQDFDPVIRAQATSLVAQDFSPVRQDLNTGPIPDEGFAGLGIAVRQLQTTGIFMDAVAHPDDENNGLLVMLNRGFGMRTVLATATRGDGGQNEIGPELGDALGVLRTAELQSMHRIDGTEQYFGRAVDFGYSFSLEETFSKWGRDEITSDFVRLIRQTRPDVIIAMSPAGTGGGQHHQASAIIVGDAFKAAGDPSKFPEQLKEGLRPWQPKKLYYTQNFAGGPAAGSKPDAATLAVDNEVYDRLLGNTFSFLGSLARSNHKSQGMAQLLALPGTRGFGSVAAYRLAAAAPGYESKNAALFDGVNATIPGLAQYVQETVPPSLTDGLKAVADAASAAAVALSNQGAVATVGPLVEGLTRVRALRANLSALSIQPDAKYEIDLRLKTKEEQFENALLIAEGMQFDVLADDGVVVAGQSVKFASPDGLIIANRGTDSVDLKEIAFDGLTGDPGCKPRPIATRTVYRCQPTLTVADGLPLSTPYWHRLPDAARYKFDSDVPFGVPFRPNPFVVKLTLVIRGVDVHITLPVRHRYEGNVFSGEKRMDLQVVPALSVRTTPSIVIVPVGAELARPPRSGTTTVNNGKGASASTRFPFTQREVRVSVTNDTRGALDAEVSLEVPKGWVVAPPVTKLAFTGEDEVQTVRFIVSPAQGTPTGAYNMRAVARALGKQFDEGFQVVEYQHVERHQLMRPAAVTAKLVDVKVRPNLLVGYVMGVGDQVPEAIEQLGARVNLLTSDDLAWGDLSRYDAIVTGVRAYERRQDLRQYNHRLLDYVKNGGTMIVQYNKMEFNQAQYGPYPAKVSNNRITDEKAPVQVLQPQNPIFHTPNNIGPSAWQGWVQERGLYFLGDKDEQHYVDLVQMEDPFPYNAGIKRGALVEAAYGKGVWAYVGLNLWRQLPSGTDGAYQLLANLISLKATGTAKSGR